MTTAKKDRKNINERIVIKFNLLNDGFSFELGRVNYLSAHKPLGCHIHNGMMEFVYIVKGKQTYCVSENEYTVSSGEIFVSFPFEEHSTGHFPEDKSFLYYFLIDLERHKEDIIGFGNADGELIVSGLKNIKQRVFKGNNQTKILFGKMIDSYLCKQEYKNTLLRNYVSQFLINILECAVKTEQASVQPDMQKILEYISLHIKENIEIDTLARIAGLSVSRFKMNFRKKVGIPPREYILRAKIEKAREIFTSTEQSITFVAHELSFSSSQYFSTVFKRYTFKTPSEFKGTLGR